MPKSPGLFLDRDGVINEDRGFVGARERFAFMPGLFPFLRAAQDMGYRLAIVTNQSGVGRGLYTEEDYEKLTAWMLGELRREGIAIDLVLACFEHKDAGQGSYRRESFWRKPNPGMILEAAQRLRIDLARSAMLGDHERDMQAALAAGVGKCLLHDGKKDTQSADGVIVVKNFGEALKEIRV